jgi:hypothetical protein
LPAAKGESTIPTDGPMTTRTKVLLTIGILWLVAVAAIVAHTIASAADHAAIPAVAAVDSGACWAGSLAASVAAINHAGDAKVACQTHGGTWTVTHTEGKPAVGAWTETDVARAVTLVVIVTALAVVAAGLTLIWTGGRTS